MNAIELRIITPTGRHDWLRFAEGPTWNTAASNVIVSVSVGSAMLPAYHAALSSAGLFGDVVAGAAGNYYEFHASISKPLDKT